MKQWSVAVAWDTEVPLTVEVLGDLAALGGTATGSPGRNRVETIVTVDASDHAGAATAGVALVTDLVPGKVARVEVMTTEEADRRLAEPAFPELVGITEIARILGVSRQRASALRANARFPGPVAVLASGPVWRRNDLTRFEEQWSRKPGRPTQSPQTGPRAMRSGGANPGRAGATGCTS